MTSRDIDTAERDIPDAVKKEKRRISPIWLLPAVALCLGIFLIYKGVIERPVDIVIGFKTAQGITVGKTMVFYKGLALGKVNDIELNADSGGVDVHVAFERDGEELLTETATFWLVKPELKGTEVKGLETIVSGNYILFSPGNGGEPARSFTALEHAPLIPDNAPGLHLMLTAETMPSIRQGSPVIYKKMPVGSVKSYGFKAEDQIFEVAVHVAPQYAGLVTRASRFWDVSGVKLEGNFTGFQIDVGSLSTILKGGLGFYTPKGAEGAEAAKNGDRFTLYPNFKTSQRGIPIVIRFPSSTGLVPGQTKVKFKGLDTGYLDRVELQPDLAGVDAHVLMDPEAGAYLGKKTKFWLVKPELSITGLSGVETLVSGNYIAMAPSKGKRHTRFKALEGPPEQVPEKGRLSIVLTSDSLGSLRKGSPVLYRRVKVGEITGHELSDTAQSVRVYAAIPKKFKNLVRENSRFWVVSGMRGSVLAGMKTESLETFLAGGVAFASPDEENFGKPAKNGAEYELHDRMAPLWETWSPEIPLKKAR